ncbi:MAG: hypothetical protein AAFX78_01900 [Cyanobacteria bacterium J06638_20]
MIHGGTELVNQSKREARWAFCLALFHAGEPGLSFASFLTIARDMRWQFSDQQVEELLRYLEEAGYCTIDEHSTPMGNGLWATRTNGLVDLVEYNADCPPAIARPDKKWW